MRKFILTALLALAIPLALTGCGGDSDNDGGSADNGKFVGTWALSSGGSIAWYILFNADNSWVISDTADGLSRRCYGTYAVDGDTAAGPMVNPGTGTGEIVATLSGDTLSLDFVEYWHNPYKHVPYTGTKI